MNVLEDFDLTKLDLNKIDLDLLSKEEVEELYRSVEELEKRETIKARVKIRRDNKKQIMFLNAKEYGVVYGGAKGGGKSFGLVVDAFNYGVDYPGADIYLFREKYDQLERNIIAEWQRTIPDDLYTYNGSTHTATMFNGTRVFFRFVKNLKDAEDYQGSSFDYLGIDEVTKHEEKVVQELKSCVRSAKGFPPRFRCTCNPGGEIKVFLL